MTGFKKFHLAECKGMDHDLHEIVLEDLSKKLNHVKDFKVAEMHSLSNKVRCSFVMFAAMVIEQH